jgi:hypothetical protein
MRPELSSAREGSAVRRGLLPEVLTPDDLAIALGLPSADAARRLLRRGHLCPYARVGQRIYVRRDALLRALAQREVSLDGPRALAVVGGGLPPMVEPNVPGRSS